MADGSVLLHSQKDIQDWTFSIPLGDVDVFVDENPWDKLIRSNDETDYMARSFGWQKRCIRIKRGGRLIRMAPTGSIELRTPDS